MQTQAEQLAATVASTQQAQTLAATAIAELQSERTTLQTQAAEHMRQQTQAIDLETQRAQHWQQRAQATALALADLQEQLQQVAQARTQVVHAPTLMDAAKDAIRAGGQPVAAASAETPTLQVALMNGHDHAPRSAVQPHQPALRRNGNGHNADTYVAALVQQPIGRRERHAIPAYNNGTPTVLTPGAVADLILLIDTSRAMAADARDVGTCLERSLQTIVQQGQPHLRIAWLGIEGTWANTPFTQSYRTYLQERGVANSVLVGRRRDTVKNQGAQKDGARAMIDLCRHFDWRPAAARLLLYLGDLPLTGAPPIDGATAQAAREVVEIAVTSGVKIFTYAGAGAEGGRPDADTELQYQHLAARTGGRAYVAPVSNIGALVHDLQEVMVS
jgi:hypothetical protein